MIKESLICDAYLALRQQTVIGPRVHLQAVILFYLKPSTGCTDLHLAGQLCLTWYVQVVLGLQSYTPIVCLAQSVRAQLCLHVQTRLVCFLLCFFFLLERKDSAGGPTS